MQEEFGPEQFQVVGVMEGDAAAAKKFILDLGATYTVLAGAGETFDSWGVSAIPQAYLVDPSGKVVADDVDAAAALLRQSR